MSEYMCKCVKGRLHRCRDLGVQQTNHQLDHIASMLQHSLSLQTSVSTEGTVAAPDSQRLPHSRDVTSLNPEKYSGEVENCRGFLLQCTLVFNRSPASSPP
ncbi:hypothetical protein AMECASPLE_018060 [Ameca splendens]|uniref:Uncharacterized protein n=1 Tax=Ameca splendens TaxID=208324 RepID=A0ABV1AAE1_9TELE